MATLVISKQPNVITSPKFKFICEDFACRKGVVESFNYDGTSFYFRFDTEESARKAMFDVLAKHNIISDDNEIKKAESVNNIYEFEDYRIKILKDSISAD